jgi:hypothetical protein
MLAMGGCVRFAEKYHFAVPSSDGGTNYYRTTIWGWSFLSTSQFAAGLYDREAVDSLFGELKGKTVSVSGVTHHTDGQAGNKKATTDKPKASSLAKKRNNGNRAGKSTPVGGLVSSREDKKLVVFLSTNSDFLVGQIESFVRSRNVQESVKGLVLANDNQELLQARSKQSVDDVGAEQLAVRITKFASRLKATDATMNAAEAKQEVVGLLRLLALESRNADGAGTIDSCSAAKTWWNTHMSAFRPGGAR